MTVDARRIESIVSEVLARLESDRPAAAGAPGTVPLGIHPDLDAAVEAMMHGAILPPFPPEMTANDIQVSVTIRFGLAR